MVKDQKGFSALEAIIILLIVIVVGGLGWFVWQKNQSDQNDSTLTQELVTKPSNASKDTKTFSKVSYGIAFDYPSDWTMAENEQDGTLMVSLSPSSKPTDQMALLVIASNNRLLEDAKANYDKVVNSKTSLISTSVKEGKFIGLDGYKYTHDFKKGGEPTFYTYIVKNSGTVYEYRITMSQYDQQKDQEIIKQVEKILETVSYQPSLNVDSE